MKRLAFLAALLVPLLAGAVRAQSGPPLDPSAIPAAVSTASAQYEAGQGYTYAGDCSQVDASAAGETCSLTWQQADSSYLVQFFTVAADGTAPPPAFDSTIVPPLQPALPPAPAPASVAPGQTPASMHTRYTGSASNATAYYCDDDPDWHTLNPRTLQSFSTVAALLAAYPTKHLHRPCADRFEATSSASCKVSTPTSQTSKVFIDSGVLYSGTSSRRGGAFDVINAGLSARLPLVLSPRADGDRAQR